MKLTRRQTMAAGAAALLGGLATSEVQQTTERVSIQATLESVDGDRATLSILSEDYGADVFDMPVSELPARAEAGGLYRIEFDRVQ